MPNGEGHIFLKKKKSFIIFLTFPTHIQGITYNYDETTVNVYIHMYIHVCTHAFNYKCTQNLA